MKTYSSRPGENEQLSENSCNLCGSPRKKRVLSCGEFSYVKCLSCGLVYQDPRPGESDLTLRYDEDYFTYELENEGNFLNLMLLGLGDIGFRTVEKKFLGEGNETVRREGEDRRARFLDIGCATGFLLKHLRSRGWATKGVEVCEPSARYGIQHYGLDIFIGTLEEARLPSGSFDVVHASHVIEHISDPLGFLREINRILSDGGVCILTTPNRAGLQARIFRERWRSAIADHVFLFSKKTLVSALKASGFSVRRIRTWGGLAAGAGPRWMKRVLDRGAKVFGFGDVMILLARKEAVP